MIDDAGLRFYAILQKADGASHTRETDNRLELLAWIEQHQRAGDTVTEVGMAATPPAVQNMLKAIAFGARRQST